MIEIKAELIQFNRSEQKILNYSMFQAFISELFFIFYGLLIYYEKV